MPTQDSVIESIYGDVRRELFSGHVLPGQRINVNELCERHGVSKSPIRNILNRLVGEGLLEVRAHDGFYRPRLTIESLRELYNWEQDMLILSVRDTPPSVPYPSGDAQAMATQVDEIEVVLRAIADRSGNTKYRLAVANVTDQLRAVRRSKRPELFNTQQEIATILDAWHASTPNILRRRLKEYYHRRLAKLSEIVADAYRGAPS